MCTAGKNDGSVDGERYFECDPKFGLFVRPDKLHIDRKGRVIRAPPTSSVGSSHRPRPMHTSTTMGALAAAANTPISTSSTMKRSKSTAEKLSDSGMRRSASKSKLNYFPDNE